MDPGAEIPYPLFLIKRSAYFVGRQVSEKPGVPLPK